MSVKLVLYKHVFIVYACIKVTNTNKCVRRNQVESISRNHRVAVGL